MPSLSSKIRHLLTLANALCLCACGSGALSPGLPEARVDTPVTTGAGVESASGTAQCAVPPVELTHTGTVANPITLRVVPTSVHPLAVCNDGTPATYLFRPGVGAGAKRWIIYLEGGGSCSTSADCKERYWNQRFYMSSGNPVDGQPYTTPLEGIKSPLPSENPDFYDANYVQLMYCSSDTWSGDRAGDSNRPISDIARWHFRGRRILEAIIAELQTQGFNSAEEVFFMGSSAGGVGVLNNADAFRARLPPSVRFVALMDAGFFIDYPSYDPATKTESTASPTARELELQTTATAWAAHGDSSCEASAPDYITRLACRSAEYVIGGGHISSPLFIRQSQADAVQLKGLIPPTEKDAPANDYRRRFADQMRTQLLGLPGVAVFSPLDTEHGVINDNAEWNASIVDGTVLPAAIGAWYRDPCGTMLQRVEVP
jgi:hypothetical protein